MFDILLYTITDSATARLSRHWYSEAKGEISSAAAVSMMENPPPVPDSEKKENQEKHPFFHYYAMLVHQQNMLQDSVRTSTYQQAMVENAPDFKDKVVLDVGTGTGILAFFAIQAGAKKVYAVEASGMAKYARELVEANGMSDQIIVLKGKVEEVGIPEKVDIIISEPMGFLLVHERMLESYVIARNRFLKPGGLMMPSTGTIYVSMFSDETLYNEQLNKVAFWQNQDFYGVDVSPLYAQALRDTFGQPVVGYFDPSVLLCENSATYTIDFRSDTVQSFEKVEIPFELKSNRTALCHGLACWFDVSFIGNTKEVVLSTSPHVAGTHWYQCRLLFKSPIAINATQKLEGKMIMRANSSHSYDINIQVRLKGSDISASTELHLQDQMYHYLQQPSAAVGGDDYNYYDYYGTAATQ